jgi:hypothetical protein
MWDRNYILKKFGVMVHKTDAPRKVKNKTESDTTLYLQAEATHLHHCSNCHACMSPPF